MENTLEQGRKLYDEGKYQEAIHVALEVVKSGQDVMEADMLAASCALKMADHLDESMIESYKNVIYKALALTKTWDEFVTLSQQYRNEMCEWLRERLLALIAQHEETFPAQKYVWDKVLETRGKFLKLKLEMDLASKLLPNVIRIAGNQAGATEEEIQADLNRIKDPSVPAMQKLNLTASKTYKAYPITDNYNAVQEEVEQAVFDTALRLFEATYNDILENNVIPGEYLNARKDEWVAGLLAPVVDLVGVVPKEGTGKDELRLERLHVIAQVYTKQLELQYVVNNRPSFVLKGENRPKYIGKLKQVYQDIKKLDSGFQPPDVDAMFTPPPAQSQKSGGCYVATCVYGSYDCPQVWTLRRYRDNLLAKTWYGRAFIRTYYAVSPTLVRWFGHTEWFRTMCKPHLDHMVSKLNTNGFEDTPYRDRQW
ncbi:MAG: hypothetical protein IJC48_07645 [Clostridia bacterium]|nr:hypothetical protein [Clostridia bacterium]